MSPKTHPSGACSIYLQRISCQMYSIGSGVSSIPANPLGFRELLSFKSRIYRLLPIGPFLAPGMLSAEIVRQPMIGFVMIGVLAVLGFLCVSEAVVSTT